MRIWLIHGFNVRDKGNNTTVQLKKPLQDMGYEVKEFRYGWAGLFGITFYNDNFAQILADQVMPGDVAIGHSNGCNVIDRACRVGAPFSQAYYIAPALNRDTTFPLGVNDCYVYHTKHDKILTLAMLIPFHPWGSMGKHGAIPTKYVNVDCTPRVFGHSHYFHKDNLTWLVNNIDAKLDSSFWV